GRRGGRDDRRCEEVWNVPPVPRPPARGRRHVRPAGEPPMKPSGLAADAERLVNPALIEHARERAESVQNRLADRITAFAGSMAFVYLHVIWFACWIGFRVEKYPFG